MDQPPSRVANASRSVLVKMIVGVPIAFLGGFIFDAGLRYSGGAVCVSGLLLILWGGLDLEPRLESALGLGIIGIGLILRVLYDEIQWFGRFDALYWVSAVLMLIGVALGGAGDRRDR